MLGSQPDPMSYVLNALAVTYICTLDDNKDVKVFKIAPSTCPEKVLEEINDRKVAKSGSSPCREERNIEI